MRKKIIFICLLVIVLIGFKTKANHQVLGIAHRGAAIGYETEENTLDALATAYQGGYQALEFDIQFTTDNVPVLKHDRDGQLEVSYDDIKGQYTLFEDVLAYFSGYNDLVLYVELKYPTTAEQREVLERLVSEYDVSIVFQISSVNDLKTLNEDYDLMVLPLEEFADLSVQQAVDLANQEDVYIGFNYELLSADDLAYIDANMTTDVYWTVDGVDNIKMLEAYSPYGIMTDETYDTYQQALV